MTLIAAIQMVSGPIVADNLREAASLIAEAAQRGARLVALPEYFPLIGASDTARLAAAEADVGNLTSSATPIQHFLAQQARQHGLWLVGGSMPLLSTEAQRVYNSCLVYDPQGQRVSRYDKIHLFSFQNGAERYDEAQHSQPGCTPVRFEACDLGDLHHIGLAICYDLRFPELFRSLGRVDLLVIPAAFTATTGPAHWELLLRTRAVENQCYVLAPAQGGHHPNGRQTYGHSLLIDPWGEICAICPQGPGIALGVFDGQRLAEIRRNLPALEHRKL